MRHKPDELKVKHAAYLARLKAKGVQTITYVAPCCGELIEDRAAPKGVTWDTAATCVHCGQLYMKVSTSSEITGMTPIAITTQEARP